MQEEESVRVSGLGGEPIEVIGRVFSFLFFISTYPDVSAIKLLLSRVHLYSF